jgi:hypothetical protein
MTYSERLEHRWGERVRVNIPVRASTRASEEVAGCLKNLSLSGALVQTDCEFGLHTLIAVRIDLSPPESRAALLNAYVSRELNGGVGIEWCEFAPNIVKDLIRAESNRRL